MSRIRQRVVKWPPTTSRPAITQTVSLFVCLIFLVCVCVWGGGAEVGYPTQCFSACVSQMCLVVKWPPTTSRPAIIQTVHACVCVCVCVCGGGGGGREVGLPYTERIIQQALNEPDSSACCKVATDYLKTCNHTNSEFVCLVCVCGGGGGGGGLPYSELITNRLWMSQIRLHVVRWPQTTSIPAITQTVSLFVCLLVCVWDRSMGGTVPPPPIFPM